MIRYPLTYAVFFQSIIKPFSSLTQYKANHALFFGELFDIEPANDAIAAGTYSDYVKGLRPVRATLTEKICPMPLETLSNRITMLGLQDMPAVLETTKKLLAITDISEQLRAALLVDAQSLTAEQFLAKVFQYSLMRSNTKIKLTKEDVQYLNNLGENISDNQDIRFAYENEHIDSIIEKSDKNFIPTDSSSNNNIYEQELRLPEDFDTFIAYIAPLFDKDRAIRFDFSHVQSILDFHIEKKACKNATIKIFEITCCMEELSSFDKVLESLHTCENCIINVMAGYKFWLDDLYAIITRVSKNLAPNSNFAFGMCYSDDLDQGVKIQLICKVDITHKKDADTPNQTDTSHDSKPEKEDVKKHTQKELKILSFLQ